MLFSRTSSTIKYTVCAHDPNNALQPCGMPSSNTLATSYMLPSGAFDISIPPFHTCLHSAVASMHALQIGGPNRCKGHLHMQLWNMHIVIEELPPICRVYVFVTLIPAPQ